jgi:hypothetical protein
MLFLHILSFSVVSLQISVRALPVLQIGVPRLNVLLQGDRFVFERFNRFLLTRKRLLHRSKHLHLLLLELLNLGFSGLLARLVVVTLAQVLARRVRIVLVPILVPLVQVRFVRRVHVVRICLFLVQEVFFLVEEPGVVRSQEVRQVVARAVV